MGGDKSGSSLWRSALGVVDAREATWLGTRVCYRFRAYGYDQTGCEFWWFRGPGPSFFPGSLHTVSYGILGEVETQGNYSYWDHFKGFLAFPAMACPFLLLGLRVYRWSRGWPVDSAPLE